MRLDKFLKVSRLIKRRTVADDACKAGRVFVNGKAAKSGYTLDEGDIIEIRLGQHSVKVRVESLQEHATKGDAETLYQAID